MGGAEDAYATFSTATTTTCTCPFSLSATTSSGSQVEVTPLSSSGSSDDAYIIVTVYDTTQPSRTSTKSVHVTLIDDDLPRAIIVGTNLVTTSNGAEKINSDDVLRVECNVVNALSESSADHPYLIEWYLDESDTGVTVSEGAMTPYQRVIPVDSPATFSLGINVAFYASIFGPGAEFTLFLQAKKVTTEGVVLATDTIASISITINNAPVPGTFTVSPDYGTEMSTLFTFTCLDWSDEDLPFTLCLGIGASVTVISR